MSSFEFREQPNSAPAGVTKSIDFDSPDWRDGYLTGHAEQELPNVTEAMAYAGAVALVFLCDECPDRPFSEWASYVFERMWEARIP